MNRNQNERLAVRRARRDDLPALEEIYRRARAFMAASGNPAQWGDSYPPAAQTEEDVRCGVLYVVCRGTHVCGAFALVPGEDPAYAVIDGAWRLDAPYLTIHRLASDGSGGVFAAALRFSRARCAHLRADTHGDNAVMQKLLERAGFVRCGIVFVEHGGARSPRLAYELLP